MTARLTPLSCEFTVLGTPQSGGSKRPVRRGKDGPILLIDMNEKKVKPWRHEIEKAASSTMNGRGPFEEPLLLVVWFYLPRPRHHFVVAGLKSTAPRFPTVRPDTTKLLRPLEDALTGLLWKDDSQIVEQIVRKRYGDPPRAEVKVAVMI